MVVNTKVECRLVLSVIEDVCVACGGEGGVGLRFSICVYIKGRGIMVNYPHSTLTVIVSRNNVTILNLLYYPVKTPTALIQRYRYYLILIIYAISGLVNTNQNKMYLSNRGTMF